MTGHGMGHGTPWAEPQGVVEWISVRDAGKHLGITGKAIRARIRRGTIVAKHGKTVNDRDGWLVALRDGEMITGGTEGIYVPGYGPGHAPGQIQDVERSHYEARLSDKDAEIARLVDQLKQRTTEVERWQLIMLDNLRRMAELDEERRQRQAPSTVSQKADDAEGEPRQP